MLVSRGHTTLGAAYVRSALVLGPRVGAVVIERDGLVFDATLLPPAREHARPHAFVYLVVAGTFAIDGADAIEAPAALVLSEEQFEGAGGARSLAFRTIGAPFRAIEIHVEESDLRGARPGEAPPRIDLDAETAAVAARLFDLETDADLVRATSTLIQRLADRGILAAEVVPDGASTPATASRLWRSLRPVVERHAPLATLKEIGGELSLRQLARDVDAFTSAYKLFVRGGWRETTSRFRLKLAVLFCSAEGASVADVAKVVGYGSVEAMGRAFRDAGLPPPREVQKRLRP